MEGRIDLGAARELLRQLPKRPARRSLGRSTPPGAALGSRPRPIGGRPSNRPGTAENTSHGAGAARGEQRSPRCTASSSSGCIEQQADEHCERHVSRLVGGECDETHRQHGARDASSLPRARSPRAQRPLPSSAALNGFTNGSGAAPDREKLDDVAVDDRSGLGRPPEGIAPPGRGARSRRGSPA